MNNEELLLFIIFFTCSIPYIVAIVIIGGNIMKRLINHFRKWWDWCKYNHSSPVTKFLVLIGVCHSPTFENWCYYGDK